MTADAWVAFTVLAMLTVMGGRLLQAYRIWRRTLRAAAGQPEYLALERRILAPFRFDAVLAMSAQALGRDQAVRTAEALLRRADHRLAALYPQREEAP